MKNFNKNKFYLFFQLQSIHLLSEIFIGPPHSSHSIFAYTGIQILLQIEQILFVKIGAVQQTDTISSSIEFFFS